MGNDDFSSTEAAQQGRDLGCEEDLSVKFLRDRPGGSLLGPAAGLEIILEEKDDAPSSGRSTPRRSYNHLPSLRRNASPSSWLGLPLRPLERSLEAENDNAQEHSNAVLASRPLTPRG